MMAPFRCEGRQLAARVRAFARLTRRREQITRFRRRRVIGVTASLAAMASDITSQLPEFAPVPQAAFGPAFNAQGYFVGRVERNLFWVIDGTYQCAFLATPDGVMLFDAPPSIGHNLRRAVAEITAVEGMINRVTHLVYSHHHADHAGAANLFGDDLARIGHEETRRFAEAPKHTDQVGAEAETRAAAKAGY